MRSGGAYIPLVISLFFLVGVFFNAWISRWVLKLIIWKYRFVKSTKSIFWKLDRVEMDIKYRKGPPDTLQFQKAAQKSLLVFLVIMSLVFAGLFCWAFFVDKIPFVY